MFSWQISFDIVPDYVKLIFYLQMSKKDAIYHVLRVFGQTRN